MSWLKRVVTHKKSKLKLQKKSYNPYNNLIDKDIKEFNNEKLDAQKKTFTRWCNAQLSKVEIPRPFDTQNYAFISSSNQPYSYIIVDLGTDLQDGIRLLKLLEILSGKETPKPERVGRSMMRIHKILNVGKALTFLQSQLQEPLQNIGSEDIVDGNLKLTMGLIWILILKYKISMAFEQEYEENRIEDITEESEEENIELTEEERERELEKEEAMDYFPTDGKFNNSSVIRSATVIGNSENYTEEQKLAKNSWNAEDSPLQRPEMLNSPRISSWRRSTIRHSKTLNRRLTNLNNGLVVADELNMVGTTSTLRKSASLSSPIASQNPKMLLLYWCQNVLKLYVDLEITEPIDDFSKSWQDGVAFLSLIHSIRSDIVPEIDALIQSKVGNDPNSNLNVNVQIPKRSASLSNPSSASTSPITGTPFKILKAGPKDWYNNLKRAFALAERYFKIVALLDPEDIVKVSNPDERIIMTYISEFYWYMQNQKKLEKESGLVTPPSEQSDSDNSISRSKSVHTVDDNVISRSRSVHSSRANSVSNINRLNSVRSPSQSSFRNVSSPESARKSDRHITFDTNEKQEIQDNINYDMYKNISYLNGKDELQKRLDEDIRNYLNVADQFSLWIKETQQIQCQILWFLFSMTNVNESLDQLSPPESPISPIYFLIFDANSNVDDLDTTVKVCIDQLENDLNNLDEGESKGAKIKQQLNKAFEQITNTASVIDKEMKDLNKNDKISSISTIYSTHSSILQHLDQLIMYTFPQTKNILQNYVRWNKEWNEVLKCVNEDLILEKEIPEESNTSENIYTNSGAITVPINNNTDPNANNKSLKQEVEEWIQKIDHINEKISELMLKREQAMKVRKNTLQIYSTKFNLYKQNITKNRWILLYNITRDQVKKSIFKVLYDTELSNKSGSEEIDKISPDDIYSTSKVFTELETELSNYSKCLNSEYPAKLNNLYQRIESLLTFIDAEFKNRTQLNTRRNFPNLPLGGVTNLTKLPTLTSIPPPNLQFSYFPQFMIKNADDIIHQGKNEVLQPLITDGIDRVANLGAIVLDLLQNITNRRKESDKLQDILLKEEQREAENLHSIQNRIMEYYRLIKRLEIWIDNNKQDLNIFKEQIPDINSRLKENRLTNDVEYIETDRVALENTNNWCKTITHTIEEMVKDNNYNPNSTDSNQKLYKSNFDKLWNDIKNDILNYENSEVEDSADESNSSVSAVDETVEGYIPKRAVHEILFNSLMEFSSSINNFVNNSINPTRDAMNELIIKKVDTLKDNWVKENNNIKTFLMNSKKNQFNDETFEEIEEKIIGQLRSIFNDWNSGIKNVKGEETNLNHIDNTGLYKYNIKEVKNVQENFNQQLNSLFQNLSQIISMRTENQVPTFNQQLLNFEKEEWTQYMEVGNNLKKILSLLPPSQAKDDIIKDINENTDQLTRLKDEVMEMNTSLINKQSEETPMAMKRLISYNNKANNVLDISKDYTDKIGTIAQLVEILTSENNINNELEKIYTTIYAAIKKMISDNSELELSEIESISLMRPTLYNIQQQLKEVIYANIHQLDGNNISKRNSLKRVSQSNTLSFSSLEFDDIENSQICVDINDFSKNYVEFNQDLIDYYGSICHTQYLDIQQLLTETTEWYNIYHLLFEWIAAADRLRVDNEERIKKYSTGGTYEVPYGYEPKLEKKRIEEIEQEQSRLENRHKEFKDGSRYRRVINSKKNIMDSVNKMSTQGNVLSKNKRLLDAVMNINEKHTSLMFTKENRMTYETESYTLLPEIIKKFVEYRLQKFTRVEHKLMEIIKIRTTDIIICKKIFNEVNLPNKALLKDIFIMNDDLDSVLLLQKQNIENIESYEGIMRNINGKATVIVNHTLELLQNLRTISENTVLKEYDLLNKELAALSSSESAEGEITVEYDESFLEQYKENKVKRIKKAFATISTCIMEKNKALNEHYERVLEELTRNVVKNWEEKNSIMATEHWIINLRGNLNKYIELHENIPRHSVDQIKTEYLKRYIKEAIATFEDYREEFKNRQPLIDESSQNTEKIVKSLRSLISSSSNSVMSQTNSLYESVQNSPTPMMVSPFESLLSSNSEVIRRRSMDNLVLSPKRFNNCIYNRPEEIQNRFKNISSFFAKINDIIHQELAFSYQTKDILNQYSNAETLLGNLHQRIEKFIAITANGTDGAFLEQESSKDGIITQFENELHQLEKDSINKNLSENIDNLISNQSEKKTILEETVITALTLNINRLKGYAKGLQEQIVSLKRSKSLVEGYINQSKEVYNWISEHHNSLVKFNKSIEDQNARCKEVNDKFLTDNVEDIPEDEIKMAYSTEEAIINDIIENLNEEEIAIKRYEITYEHLKTYSKKILSDSTINEKSILMIRGLQENVDQRWANLSKELEVLKNRLEIRMKVLLWIKNMGESEAVMWKLEEDIEKGDELNVEVNTEDNPAIQFGKAVDEVVRNWEYQVSFCEETHENLRVELRDIEVRAETLHCENDLDVFNRKWYLNNITESLNALQQNFEYKKDRLFGASQQLEQWIIHLNGLEEWITVTNSTLKDNLATEDFALIGDNDASNQTNVKMWSHNQISLSLQISNEISNKLKTLNTIRDELVRTFTEVVAEATRESYLSWINECHNKLNTLYQEIEQMKIITDKLLERATQYQQWQSKLLAITSDVDDISEMVNYEEVDDNMYIALYDRLNNLEKALRKIESEQSIPEDLSDNATEKANASSISKRTEELHKRIDENRKIIQDSQENITKIKILNTINQELERIDLWCTATMRDLPKASLLMESMDSGKSTSTQNMENLPAINIEAISKCSDDDLFANTSVGASSTTETALRDAIKLHNFVEMELQQSQKDIMNLRQAHEETFKNIPSLDNQYQVLQKRLEAVEETIIFGLNRIEVIKRVYSHDKTTYELYAWMEVANKKLQGLMNEGEGENKMTSTHDLEGRMEIFDASVKDYISMTEKVQAVIQSASINAKEKSNYSRIVSERTNAILSEWDIIKELLTSIKNDNSQKEREMKYNLFLNEINDLITDIKERIYNVGKLNNISTRDEDQLNIVFGRLEGELIAGVYPKITQFERVLEESTDHETNEYVVFHNKLENLNSQADILIDIINERKIKLRILKYVQNHNKVTDKIEQQINEFNRVIENQGQNMTKSDIETALAVLDSKAMYFNASIFKMLEEAKEQLENIKECEEEMDREMMGSTATLSNSSKNHSNTNVQSQDQSQPSQPQSQSQSPSQQNATSSKDDWKVLERQHQIEKKWETVKSKVKRRKDILSAKLIAKTEGPSNSNIPRSSSSRIRASSTSSLGHYRNTVLRSTSTTPTNSRAPSRSRSRSVTPGNSLKMRSMIPSKSPTPPAPPVNLPSGPIRVFIPVNDYIPDPKDKLDVEVARIVNKCPKSIKVTKAEGEGKYWFGEVIPKLCYCRYLRSGIIMVRVGGGWQELSKFLLEHSNLEHRIPMVRSFAPEDAIDEEQEGQVIEIDRNVAGNTSYSNIQRLAVSKKNSFKS